MKIGCQTNMWGGGAGHPAGVTSIKDLYYLTLGPDEQSLREASLAGFDGVEIFDGNLNRYHDNPGQYEALLSDNGLKLAALYSGANFIYPDALEDEMARLERAASLGERYGALFFTIGGGAVRAGGTREGDYDLLARGLDAVVAVARPHGLVAAYHPHLGTMSEGPEALTRIMALTEIALCPDLGHVLAGGGDPVEVVHTYRDRIPYIHLKDYADGLFVPLGEGKVDLKGVVAELSGDYRPEWWTVEVDQTDRPLEMATKGRRVAADLLGVK